MAKAKLSGYFKSIQGKVGEMVFTDTKYGTVMREDAVPANPRSASQNTYRAYFSRSAKGYASLSPANVEAWRVWAAANRKVEKDTKVAYTPNPFNAYTSLANKFYAANAGVGTAPAAPPAGAFAGDPITITATAAGGKVSYVASAANSANVVTELWLQPLKNANRKPSASGYRVKAYYPFAAGNLTLQLPVPPGYYAAGYRFVSKLTGQTTAFVPISASGLALTIADGDAEAAPAPRAKKAA